MATIQSQYEEMCEVFERYNKGDLVPVVRCEECKWYYQLWIDAGIMVEHCHRVRGVVVKADGYCAWGERREDGEVDRH